MNKKINAMFMIILLVTTMFGVNVNAQVLGEEFDIDPRTRDVRDTGETIVINVDSYEPPVVESFLLEKDSVPVYAYLKGFTIGSLIGAKSIKSEPILGDVNVRNVIVLLAEENPYVRFVRHMFPDQKRLSLDNLGVVQIMLEKIPEEEKVPDNIVVNLTARVTFDRQSGIFGFGSQDLRLKEERNENKWLGNMGERRSLSITSGIFEGVKARVGDVASRTAEAIKDVISGRARGGMIYGGRTDVRSIVNEETAGYDDSFWGGSGYVRLARVTNNEATLIVYDKGLKNIARLNLRKDATSGISEVVRFKDRLAGMDRFRVQLLDIVDPSEDFARVEVDVGGSRETRILRKNDRVYPNSRWFVKEIRKDVKEGVIRESVLLSDDAGEEREITRDYGDASEYNQLEFKTTGEIKIDKDSKLISQSPDSEGIIEQLIGELDGKGISRNRIKIVPNELNEKFGERVSLLNRIRNLHYSEGELFVNKLIELADMASASVIIDGKTIVIRANSEGDVCGRSFLEDEDVAEEYKKNVEESAKKFYCSAIREYDEITKLFKDQRDENKNLYSDVANLKITKTYLELSRLISVDSMIAKSRALDALDKIVEAEKFNEIGNLRSEASDISSRYKDDNFVESNEIVNLRLINTNIGKESKGSEVFLSLDGKKSEKFNVGDYVFVKGKVEVEKEVVVDVEKQKEKVKEEKSVGWLIESVNEDGVVFSGITYDKDGRIREEKVTLDIGKEKVLRVGDSAKRVKVENINFNKEVTIRILPGVTDAFSESNFLVRIPIEKRLFDFNPKKIDKRIEKTEEKIKKLTAIIDKLERLLEGWKKLCLAVFAFFTIKNSFLGGFAKSQARKEVMQAPNGWQKFCDKSVGEKKYKSVDECMIKNNRYILEDISAAQKSIKETNNAMKQKNKEKEKLGENYIEKIDIAESGFNFDKVNEYQKNYKDVVVSSDEERELRYYINLKKNCKSGRVIQGVKDYKGVGSCEEIDERLKGLKNKYDTLNEKYGLVNEFVKGYEDKIKVHVESTRVFETSDRIAAREAAEFDAEKVIYYSGDKHRKNNKLLGKFSSDNKFWIDYRGTPYPVEIKDGNGYCIKNGNVAPWMRKLENGCIFVDEEPISIRGFEAPMYISGKGAYTVFDGKVVVVEDENKVNINGLDVTLKPLNEFNIDARRRLDYAPGATVEFYPDGKPYCVPTRSGNFVRVNDYNKLGNPSDFDILNVGADGLLCTDDDVLVYHNSLMLSDTRVYGSIMEEARRSVRNAAAVPEGGVLSAAGKRFGKSTQRAAVLGSEVKPNCYDVMNPRDCQIMFNVCDPVMCPPSRFNLGGRWVLPPGQSVVQTGIIGSLVLGWPIITAQQPIPKVCMTGILAGLKNIRSLLQGYVRCLTVAKTEKKNVGICDKIRSVGICELLWKEAIAIFKIQGGLVSLISEKLFKETAGGGEYLTFQSSLQNVENSVNFFTTEYASTAFSAYQGRSLQDIGTDICRSAIFGRFPGIGEFVDQLAKPESPPQFTAFFSEFTHNEATKESRYDVFYHLYAGDDAKVQYPLKYSVYLRNKFGDFFYITEECAKRSGTVERNDFKDISTHCVSLSNLDEICVDINGVIECGFGKVTSSFAVDFANDFIVKSEAERNIKSVKDCVADNPRLSPLFGDTVSKLPLPGEFALTNTGIVRVCGANNPGAIISEAKFWQPVGECGKDKGGVDLGLCWIDLRTISVNDANKVKSLSRELETRGIKLEEKALGFKPISDEEAGKVLEAVDLNVDAGDLLKKIGDLRRLSIYAFDPIIRIKALMLLGDIFVKLGDEVLKKVAPEEESKKAKPKDKIIETFNKFELELSQKVKDVEKNKDKIERDSDIGFDEIKNVYDGLVGLFNDDFSPALESIRDTEYYKQNKEKISSLEKRYDDVRKFLEDLMENMYNVRASALRELTDSYRTFGVKQSVKVLTAARVDLLDKRNNAFEMYDKLPGILKNKLRQEKDILFDDSLSVMNVLRRLGG
ncbi:hypothetical protein HY498_03735 [Candidatus Woesearchaeota archaeon]|nr:hypothetical protein [Candidatus Woesearchaeota archaeon]